MIFAAIYNRVSQIMRDEKGQGMVEYGLIIALVAIALIGVLEVMTGAISSVFTEITETLSQ